MSVAATRFAWELVKANPRLKPGAKLVLLALADHANAGTGKAWPAVDTIATEAGLSRAKVYEAFAELADLVPSMAAAGPKGVRVWHFPKRQLADVDQAESVSTGVQNLHPQNAAMLSTGVQNLESLRVQNLDKRGPGSGPKPRENRLNRPPAAVTHPAIAAQHERDLIANHAEAASTMPVANWRELVPGIPLSASLADGDPYEVMPTPFAL